MNLCLYIKDPSCLIRLAINHIFSLMIILLLKQEFYICQIQLETQSFTTTTTICKT